MTRRRKPPLADAIQGQHLSLSVAAHLARTQLVADPQARYDGTHLLEMVDAVACALIRVAPVYAQDSTTGGPRALSPAELEGARFRQGLLELCDGRRLSSVTMKRAELRQAIAILKAVGVPGLGGPHTAPQSAPEGENPLNLHALLNEIDDVLQPPLDAERIQRANRLSITLARRAAQGRVANLAMQLVSALHDSRSAEDVPGGFRMALARLRAALEENARSQ